MSLRPLLREILTLGVWHRVWTGTTRMTLMHTLLHHTPPLAPARPPAAHLTSQASCPTKLTTVEYPGHPEPWHLELLRWSPQSLSLPALSPHLIMKRQVGLPRTALLW